MGAVVVVSVVTMVIMAMVGIGILVEALFAMEHQEIHTERVKRRHKNTSQHRKMRKACGRQMALRDRFNDAVLGVKSGEKRRTNQGQRA